ncbi:MAG: hypothetical protein NXH75_03205, partial [Halobacteriovoraceae bacterium]|nr:hypothetical protein [Halobacteriovoraceae bacterium]
MKAILLTIFTFMTSVYADIHCGNPQSPMEIMICSQYFYAEDLGQSPTRCEHEATPQQTAELTLANGRSARPLPGLTSGFTRDGADCTDFIRRDGSLGSSGRIVRDYIASSSRRNHFLNPRHIAEACPRWNNMSEAEREHFWVWSIASIAWDESRCVSGRRNTAATNGVGVGLLQLNEDYGGRSWRGPNCRVQSVRSDENNIKCG